MRITWKKQPFGSSVTLNGSVLEKVYEFRELGLLTNHTNHQGAVVTQLASARLSEREVPGSILVSTFLWSV